MRIRDIKTGYTAEYIQARLKRRTKNHHVRYTREIIAQQMLEIETRRKVLEPS